MVTKSIVNKEKQNRVDNLLGILYIKHIYTLPIYVSWQKFYSPHVETPEAPSTNKDELGVGNG